MPGLFERSPRVLAGNVHLSKKYGHLAVADVRWKKSCRNFLPSLYVWLFFSKFPVNDCAAVALNNCPVLPDDDSLDQPFVDQHLTVEVTDIRIIPEKGLKLSLEGLSFFGFNVSSKAYVEVLSFQKILADAHKRNRVFFEKLGLPS